MPPDSPRQTESAARTPRPTRPRSTWFGHVAGIVLAGVAAVTVGVPAAAVAVQTAGSLATKPAEGWRLAREAISLQTIVNTGLCTLGIGALATVLALPAAWVLARPSAHRRGSPAFRDAAWGALILSPLLLPSYLAYAGWGSIRGPNTSLGDWLAVQDPRVSIVAGRAMAVAGMTLWIWPLAAVTLAAAVRALGPDLSELARLDAPSRVTRAGLVARAMRSGLVSTILLVALVMTGSAIPLHVAQVPTYAIQLWKVMQLTPDPAGVWVASVPLLLLAGGAAAVMVRRMVRPTSRPDPVLTPGPAPRAARLGTAAAWGLSVAAPLGLFAWSLQSWRSVPLFWRLSGAGALQSLQLAAWTAGLAAAVLMLTWVALDLGGRWGRAAAIAATGLLLFSGLLPGVLVGAAMSASAGFVPGGEGIGLVVLTHLARFGFVAALGGWWLASLQPREERWMRDMDAGGSPWAWVATTARPQAAPTVGLTLAVAALSFHEIESTVMVLPPGLANLPQQLLDYLHYARDEQLSAAAVNLLSLGVVFALMAAALTAMARRTTAPPPPA